MQEVLPVRVFLQRFCQGVEVTLVYYGSMLGNLFRTVRVVDLSVDYSLHRKYD